MGNPKGVKRDFKALEKRRFEAMRLLDQGHNQSETARRLKVARQTVHHEHPGTGRPPGQSGHRLEVRGGGNTASRVRPDSARPGAPDASRSSMPHNANA